jgi:hypothetical protein
MAAVLRKSIVFLRISRYLLIALVLIVAGCTQMKVRRNADLIQRLQTGASYEQVVETLGEPILRENITQERFVTFYQTLPGRADEQVDIASLCTPVAFEDEKLAGIGKTLYERWVRDEEERIRWLQLYKDRRRKAQKAEASRLRRVAERNNKIAALEKKVAPIPASNAALNLKLYRQLLVLDPRSARYQKKVAYYEERLARQKEAEKARAEKNAKEKLRRAWEANRETRNKIIGQYTGNGTAEMAVYDMGNHSLYVWVKNVSQQIITTHPDYFTLMDNDDTTIPCLIEASLNRVLEPGSLSHGKIDYAVDSIPKELIFQNRESGTVRKVLQ